MQKPLNRVAFAYRMGSIFIIALLYGTTFYFPELGKFIPGPKKHS